MTQTFTLPAQQISANVELDSPAQAVVSTISSARVQLTSNQWGTTPSATQHVQVWGLQLSRDNGVTWLWWLFSGDPTVSNVPVNGGYSGPTGSGVWLPFGSLNKDGSLPFINVESSDIIEAANMLVRLAIVTDANIRAGASITVA